MTATSSETECYDDELHHPGGLFTDAWSYCLKTIPLYWNVQHPYKEGKSQMRTSRQIDLREKASVGRRLNPGTQENLVCLGVAQLLQRIFMASTQPWLCESGNFTSPSFGRWASGFFIERSGEVAHRIVHLCFTIHPSSFQLALVPQMHTWNMFWCSKQLSSFSLPSYLITHVY